MGGSGFSAILLGELGDGDEGCGVGAIGVEGVWGWSEDDVYACFLEELQIFFSRTRIFCVVFCWAELGGVNKDADDGDVVF